MKRIFILLIVNVFSLHIFSQGCYDPLEDFIRNTEKINSYNSDFKIGLPGKSLSSKAAYFVEVWQEIKMAPVSSDIGYIESQLYSPSLNVVGFTQTFKGAEIVGTHLVLGFDNDGYLKQFSHYGMDDSGRLPKVKRVNSTDLISPSDQMSLISESKKRKFEFVNGVVTILPEQTEALTIQKTIGPPPPPPAQMIAGSIWVSPVSQSYTYNCEGDIAALNGLQEVGVGGSNAGIPNDRLTLVQVGGNYKIADNDASVVYSGATDYAHNSSDYLICPEQLNTSSDPAGKFEYAMCYNYITMFSDFFDDNFAVNGVDDFGTLVFDPYDGNGSLTYVVTSDILAFGSADNNSISGYHDIAEDVHFIAEGAAHYWWKNTFSGNMPSDSDTGEGVLYGSLDYLASQFTGGMTEVLSWGGNGDSRVLDLDQGVNYNNFVNATNSSQENGQLWGSTLNDIATHGDLGSAIANALLSRSMNFMNAGTDQVGAATILFKQGKEMRDEGLLSNTQLCVLAAILDNRYPSSDIDILAKDVYIKDSFAGQQTGSSTNQEDFGVEPSVTTNFWISPAIWNRRNLDFGTSHENPHHDVDQQNFLFVEVRDRGCEKPEGTLKMYFSEASTGHVWPEDWDNVTPTNDHLGYHVGSVDLDDDVAQYFDANNELVYLYVIPWIPLDPTDFDGYEAGDNMHGCMLGRIASLEDPMFNEQTEVHVSVNSKNNNNVAMRNMTLIHVDSGPVAPPSVPDKHVFIIKHGQTPDLIDQNPVKDMVKINVVPGGAINPDDLFDYGNIEIELSEPLLKSWKEGGMKGQNVKFASPNRILIFNPKATLENLVIDPNRKYPIRVMFTRKRDLPYEVNFDITLWNENECEVGGEMYKITPKVELETRSFKSNNSISTTILSPNPVADELTLESNVAFGAGQIKLYNSAGRKFSVEMVTKNEKSVLINTTSLQSGIYFINIQRDNGDYENMKFIKL